MLTAFAITFAGCGKSEAWREMKTEEIPSLMKLEFDVKEGMSRDDVEHVLGPPTDIGRTKEGYPFAQYRDGLNVRSVIYDFDNAVITAYPK